MNLTRRLLATVTAATLLAALAPAPVVGVSPTASSEPVLINEDGGATTVTLTAADPDGGLITGFAISKDPAKGAVGTPSIPTCGAPGEACTATVVYTPDTDANGGDSFEFTATDDNLPSETSTPATVTITITAVNDEPVLAIGGNQSVAEDAGAQAVPSFATKAPGGGPDESGQTTTYGVTNSNNALFSAQPAISPTGTLTYTPAANANGAATVTVHVTDSGGTSNGGDDTSPTQQFTITVTPVNDAPSFTRGANQTGPEDAGAQTVPAWATGTPGPANESGQALAYVIDSITNASLFSVAPAVSSTGTLTYTPAANANGTSTVTLHVTDNGGGTSASPTQQFTITVTPVNDAPAFVKGADVAAPEDAGPQVVPGWATGIAAGPADEGSQALTFVVTGNTVPTLFATQPAVDAAGSLTFRPAFNQSGTATISIVLRDNGGIAGGGIDASTTQAFDITVSGANDAPNAGNDVVSVRLGPPVTLDVLRNDDGGAGEPGDQPRIVSVAEGSGSRGLVSVTPDGRSLVYDPIGCTTGQHVFQYTIADGGGLMATATVVVTLLAPSSYPAADGPRPSFVTGTTIGSTVPVRLSWCGVTSGTTIDAYRLYQSINDGSYTTRIDKTTATSSTRSVSVSPTRHQFKVRVKDRKSRYAYGTGPDFRVGRYQNTSSSIVYSTGWSTSRNTRHSGDSVKGTSASGGSATFTYTGRGFAIVGPRSSTRGKFKVYVDGTYRATVSERASSAQYRRVLYAASLTHGRHTVRIVAAGGGRIDLDAILTLTGY